VDKKGKTEGLARKEAPRRGRSRWEKEIRQRLIIEAVIVVTIVAALAIVGYGYYDTKIRPWHQPIVRVNDTVFDMRCFVKMLRLYGLDSTSDTSSAESVATTIQYNELMKQGLKKEFGIVISDEAIEEELQEVLSSYSMTAEELEENLATVGISKADFKQMYIEPILVQEELQNRIGDEKYPSDVSVPHVLVQAMLVQGEDNAAAVKSRWDAGEEFDQLVDEYSPSESYGETSSDSDNVTGEWLPQAIESDAFDEFAFAEGSVGILSDPIPESEGSENYWVIKVLDKADRLLSDDHRDTLIDELSDEWLEDAENSEENKLVSYLDDEDGLEKISWALDHI
jgi:hypothetical protein